MNTTNFTAVGSVEETACGKFEAALPSVVWASPAEKPGSRLSHSGSGAAEVRGGLASRPSRPRIPPSPTCPARPPTTLSAPRGRRNAKNVNASPGAGPNR